MIFGHHARASSKVRDATGWFKNHGAGSSSMARPSKEIKKTIPDAEYAAVIIDDDNKRVIIVGVGKTFKETNDRFMAETKFYALKTFGVKHYGVWPIEKLDDRARKRWKVGKLSGSIACSG